MSNTIVLRNFLRAVFLLALQVLVLKQINIGGADFNYITIFLYPVFLMFLPMSTPVWLMMVIGFFYGYSIDFFSDSIGMHAAASVFTCYFRAPLLRLLEPPGGYKQGVSPTRNRMGFPWFLRYAGIFMLLHIFIFFSVEVFTLLYIDKILLYTLPSFVVSFIFVMIYSFLFDPVE